MTRRCRVILTEDAARDLDEIFEYVAFHDAPQKAEYVLDRIGRTIESLATLPEPHPCTKELLAIGIREFRETYFKPYRIVYGIDRNDVTVYLIADGRRDMHSLLQKRLLRP
ncbi:MAG TPA: type II toxin-antitoxin system RelE/ParE family toxin [Ramlibacter sp.]|uniref:type II toxin-antitoxin system RelE/ParE family toxin n=1 Tax=Ramlibacter sp. TaxID=1917967 RepID=UPI002CF64263|nr:type II toxin-antitoxin system RelE/ParE family toxin [Ramlibacter sp.]HVZ46705.1 type II toxin-antitoxin system RelE/ParE family toxin [Ramlibacter sp.]